MTRSTTIYALAIAAGLIRLFAIQQAPFVVRGDYSREVVWQATSPDERYRLEVGRRATFPAFDILDPAGTALFTVIDQRTGRTAASSHVPLDEIFDFQPPKVEWTSDHVEVLGYDESHPSAVVRLLLVH